MSNRSFWEMHVSLDYDGLIILSAPLRWRGVTLREPLQTENGGCLNPSTPSSSQLNHQEGEHFECDLRNPIYEQCKVEKSDVTAPKLLATVMSLSLMQQTSRVVTCQVSRWNSHARGYRI